MPTDRPFRELNLWQRIFAERWETFKGSLAGAAPPTRHGTLDDLWAEEDAAPAGIAGGPPAIAEEEPLFSQLLFAFATG